MLGNLGVTLPTTNFFVVHMVHGVASARKHFKCWAFAALIDLKYPWWKAWLLPCLVGHSRRGPSERMNRTLSEGSIIAGTTTVWP